jgi:asparagine synthase (glutamine-hydrolysing)
VCGIYGRVGRPGPGHKGLSAIRRRGPDDLGVWADADHGVWLGHRRLAIIDCSAAGHQPMVSPNGRVVMIYNGEIYNYAALRAELESEGEVFAGHSDSEVLLRMFERDGPKCLARLNGIWAAAFWERDRLQLTIIRDPFGVKPLYVTQHGGGIAFSSEMKALLHGGDAPARINHRALLHHLGYLWSPGRETIVEGIEKILPGELMTFDAKTGATSRCIYADPLASPVVDSSMRADDAAKAVRGALQTAVERQLVTDVPLGSFLSGGLDSSAIVACAMKALPVGDRLQCFSIDIAGGMGAEGFTEDLPYARRVAKYLGVDLHVVTVDRNMMQRLSEMLYYTDEPTPDPAAISALLIAELARSQGIKVLLSGAGGDDIFTGYRRHYALMQERFWSWWPKPARTALRAASSLLPISNSIGRRAAKAFQYADRPEDTRLASYFLWLDPERALALLSRAMRGSMTTADMYTPMFETLEKIRPDSSPMERMLYLEGKHFLVDHNLNYTDKTGMAAGVEVRVPLLDPDLVSLSQRLPLNMRQRGRTGKWIFKKAMEPMLPRDVIYRPKSGFGVPLRQWMHTSMADVVHDALSHERITARGLFDSAEVHKLIADDAAGRIDATYTIFAMVCLELWCRQFIDGTFAVENELDDVREPEPVRASAV